MIDESTKCAEDAKMWRELNDANSEEILLQIAELSVEEQKLQETEKENQALVEKVQHLKDELKLRIDEKTKLQANVVKSPTKPTITFGPKPFASKSNLSITALNASTTMSRTSNSSNPTGTSASVASFHSGSNTPNSSNHIGINASFNSGLKSQATVPTTSFFPKSTRMNAAEGPQYTFKTGKTGVNPKEVSTKRSNSGNNSNPFLVPNSSVNPFASTSNFAETLSFGAATSVISNTGLSSTSTATTAFGIEPPIFTTSETNKLPAFILAKPLSSPSFSFSVSTSTPTTSVPLVKDCNAQANQTSPLKSFTFGATTSATTSMAATSTTTTTTSSSTTTTSSTSTAAATITTSSTSVSNIFSSQSSSSVFPTQSSRRTNGSKRSSF